MIPLFLNYATPSVFESDRDRALLGFSTNARRPVRFHGRVRRDTFLLRTALRALGALIWSDDTWMGGLNLDPIVTVHPDRLFFEAFSQDLSAFGLLVVPPDLFETEGEVRYGTTNVDFTAWLWGALGEMRSSRETTLRIGPEGLELRTVKAGGCFEQKVEVPLPWVRGFLHLQACMALPGTMLRLRPVDLLAAIRFLRYTKARMSPRALRYEMEPGQDARIVLEPWEQVVSLKGASHGYTEPRTIRTWGRRRLRLLEGLLPFADSVDVYLKGRALPSFYAVHIKDITFVLGLTGWTGQPWTGTGGFGDEFGGAPASQMESAREALSQQFTISGADLAQRLGVDGPTATRLLVGLCRQGRAIYDVGRRVFRHRELFEKPVDESLVFPPDPRREEAAAILAEGRVKVDGCQPRETRKVRKLPSPDGPVTREIIYRDWHVVGHAGQPVEIVVNDTGRVIFGTCACAFFKENLLNQGPCAHMLALYQASEALRVDLATSQVPIQEPETHLDEEEGEE